VSGIFAKFLGANLRHPKGLFGWAVLRQLDRLNAAMMRASVEGLELAPGHAFLDVGFGGGGTFALAAPLVAGGKIAGLDPSHLAFARARRRFGHLGADLRLGRVPGLPWNEWTFDAVSSTNTIYFWDDAGAVLADIFRVLKPGGRLALGVYEYNQLREMPFTRRHYILRDDAEITELLLAAGFEGVTMAAGTSGKFRFHIFFAAKPGVA